MSLFDGEINQKEASTLMLYLFPAVFMSNSLAMTALLIVLGLAGKPIMAADIGIVQAATLALFYALSANARNLILNTTRPVPAQFIMIVRILLLVPIVGVIFWLSTRLSGVDSCLAGILILRRSVEWLGEVHLSEMERADNRKFGLKYLLTQSLLLITALSWTLGNMPFPLFGLFIWALLPLLFSMRFIRDTLYEPWSALQGAWQRIFPHVGSTTVIGVSVYVFRLLIILIVGKTIAGDLFTAFALGGVLGSLFANALGPSIALHESRSGIRSLPLLIRLALYASLALGAVIFITSVYMPNLLNWTGKNAFFWKATGLSILGGVVMVNAQMIRNRFLQQHNDSDVFGPDVLMNILVIAAVPFSYYLLGMQAMAVLSLLSAVLAFVFYRSCESDKCVHVLKSASQSDLVRIVIAVMLLLPIFFQVSSGIFRDPNMIYDTGGILTRLPIPLSVFACFGGILILGAYRHASKSLAYLFFTFMFMIVSTVIVCHGQLIQEQTKLIFMIQFILPMFGLFLGEIYESEEKSDFYSRAFFYTLAVIVPLHLLCTWLQGLSYLSPYMYFFSIYQHLQYVPVIFVSAYLIAFYDLWQSPKLKKVLLIMAPIMGIYVAASLSMLAMLLLFVGLLVFAVYYWILRLERLPVVIFLTVLLTCGSYVYYAKDSHLLNFTLLKSTLSATETNHIIYSGGSSTEQNKVMAKTNTWMFADYWQFYAKQVTKNAKVFLLGHADRPDRTLYPSAHNFYLDFVYNFGVFALLPLMILLIYTLKNIYFFRHEIIYSPNLLGLSTVVLFLLLVDNSLKVGLRQPYPGIFTFFIWGVLLRKLSILANGRSTNAF